MIVERLLAITGEDSLSIDRKFLPAWNGQLPTRFLMLSNELPKLNDASGAITSRFIVLRLSASFFGKEDLALTATLLTELPAILGWAIDGRERLARRGRFPYNLPPRMALQEMTDLASPIGAFLRERCKVGAAYSVECDRLHSALVHMAVRTAASRLSRHQADLRSRPALRGVPALEVRQPRDGKWQTLADLSGAVGLIAPNSDEAKPQRRPDLRLGAFPTMIGMTTVENPAW